MVVLPPYAAKTGDEQLDYYLLRPSVDRQMNALVQKLSKLGKVVIKLQTTVCTLRKDRKIFLIMCWNVIMHSKHG